MMRAGENREHKAKRGDALTHILSDARARLGGELHEVDVEHKMRKQHAENRARELREQIRRGVRARQLTPREGDQRNRRIEVGAGQPPQDRDQHVENARGGRRVREQRHREIPLR